MRSIRSKPQGSPIHRPGSGMATTRPKRRTTARWPGLIGLSPVSNETATNKAITARMMRFFIDFRQSRSFLGDTFPQPPKDRAKTQRRRENLLAPLRLCARRFRFRIWAWGASLGRWRFEEQIEQVAVAGQEQNRLIVAQDSLILLQLFQEGIEVD